MTHVRHQIRDKVVAVLRNLPTTGPRCYAMRTYPTGRRKGPRLLVYTLRETSETGGMGGGGRDLERTIELKIEVQAAGRNFDDTLDQAAAEIEPVIFQNRKFDGLAVDCSLTSTVLEMASDEEERGGVLTLTYSVLVIGPEGNPHIAG